MFLALRTQHSLTRTTHEHDLVGRLTFDLTFAASELGDYIFHPGFPPQSFNQLLRRE
jgi:hypothetical protein